MTSKNIRSTAACTGTALAMLLGGALATPATAGQAPGLDQGTTASAATHEVQDRSKPRKGAKRALRVKITRPADAKKLVKVTVKGPKQPGKRKKFKKTFRKTKTFKNLKPGTYRIKATTITLFDQRIRPTVVKKKVRIKKRTKRKTSRVSYATPVFCSTSGTTAYGWGEGDHGRLGTTDATDRLIPTVIPRIRGLKAITGGLRSTYGLCQDGTVWAWGFNQNGELGIGRSGNRAWPVKVPGLTGITAIEANRESVYALKTDGTLWAWGSGRYGQLGNGRSGFGYRSDRPVRVNLPAGAKAIAAGGYTGYAILRDGRVASWGNGGVGQRGDGTTGESTPTPVLVSGITAAEQIAAGHATAYVKVGGELHAWGDNGEREVPDFNAAPPANHPVPHVEAPGSGLSHIGASGSAGYLVLNGETWSWGSGRHHDTGRDTGGSPTEPDPSPALPVGVITAFAGAGYGGYALTDTGQIWAWGSNSAGQVGTGAAKTGPASTQGLLPARITGLSGVKAIGAGNVNGYALR